MIVRLHLTPAQQDDLRERVKTLRKSKEFHEADINTIVTMLVVKELTKPESTDE